MSNARLISVPLKPKHANLQLARFQYLKAKLIIRQHFAMKRALNFAGCWD